MEYHGLADLTLKYRSLGGEKSATCSGITVQLFREPNWRWTVIFHDPTNQAPLDGLIRAVVRLPDGRRLDGAAERTPNLGGNFTLIEDRER
ncbi:hypothetical protein [Pseudomonas donghuensis]|uniref:hypothetical protein n=1 Tax=Pseudomonas donghuensis TaxID=1163398 RepID=UPI000C2ABC9C|nr:hypothetical protein [Pseudomonas donghuensis]PJY97920.1 hypothetical protein COO64_07490 [Pseudomonas donghuensis]WKY27187.1 hypothetical protein QYF67_20205 [Pseudomonas donghuensis]